MEDQDLFCRWVCYYLYTEDYDRSLPGHWHERWKVHIPRPDVRHLTIRNATRLRRGLRLGRKCEERERACDLTSQLHMEEVSAAQVFIKLYQMYPDIPWRGFQELCKRSMKEV
jgi:hypothetical protein